VSCHLDSEVTERHYQPTLLFDERRAVIALQLTELPLEEVWHQQNPSNRGRFAVVIHAGTGAASTAVGYLELEPGSHAGMHVDTAEETFYVVKGEAEIVVGDERERLEAGGLALGPAMVPHDVHNVGEDVLEVLMFFTSAAVLTDHEDVLAPMGLRMFTMGGVRTEQPVSVGQ
jgi:mannose-6-phosphate isomerase-like protein (cupin superfamily)